MRGDAIDATGHHGRVAVAHVMTADTGIVPIRDVKRAIRRRRRYRMDGTTCRCW